MGVDGAGEEGAGVGVDVGVCFVSANMKRSQQINQTKRRIIKCKDGRDPYFQEAS